MSPQVLLAHKCFSEFSRRENQNDQQYGGNNEVSIVGKHPVSKVFIIANFPKIVNKGADERVLDGHS